MLGDALRPDGSMSPALRSRLEKALDLAQREPAAVLVLSGGVPQAGTTEAYVMSRWLADRGVPPARMRLDDTANDTVRNALHACALLERLGAARATVVTSPEHLHRATLLVQEACRDLAGMIEAGASAVVAPQPTRKSAISSKAWRRGMALLLSARAPGWKHPSFQRKLESHCLLWPS